ncbi:reverse transcriptase domain-containing protein, partial [Tanacetum coccineum]
IDNEISFPSVPRCRLVDSPIILEALIEGFLVRRIYVDGGSSSKVMYEHCFRNLGTETKAKLRESRVPLVGFTREVNYPMGVIDLNDKNDELGGRGIHNPLDDKRLDEIIPRPPPLQREATLDRKGKGKDELVEAPRESKPPEKVAVRDKYPDQSITIGGDLSAECRVELIKAKSIKEEEHSSGQKEGGKGRGGGARGDYASMKKIGLALVHAARGLEDTFLRAIELGAYGITYAPRNAIKGQVVADFLVDTMAGDDPMDEGMSDPDEHPARRKAPETSGNEKEHKVAVCSDETDTWKLYIDGASNDHGSGAEYEALLAGLRIAVEMKVEKIHAFVDSKFVASQKNKKAVTLKVNVIVEEETRTWMTLIGEYIEKGILPNDPAEARTIREKVNNYTIEDGILYRKSYIGPLLCCIGPKQANYVIRELHMGSYGMHDRPRKVVHKAMNAG